MATVELAIYDLTMGMAKQMAAPLAGLLDGKTVEMVPHTGVVFGREIVYAGGVLSQPIATVEAGMGRKPNQIERLGTTTKTEAKSKLFCGASRTSGRHELRPVGAQLQQLLGARRPIFVAVRSRAGFWTSRAR